MIHRRPAESSISSRSGYARIGESREESRVESALGGRHRRSTGSRIKSPVSPTHAAIPIAQRINRFSYAIRNIAVEAERVEASGMRGALSQHRQPSGVRFSAAPHLIEAVERAMHRGENGYGPSVGVRPAGGGRRPSTAAAGGPSPPTACS